jgi:cAMP-dependent protein kinase regulator
MEELQAFLDEKKVKALFKELMEQICLEKPDNIYTFIVSYIQDKYSQEMSDELVHYEEEEEEEAVEENDVVTELDDKPKAAQSGSRRRRSAVSAESVNPDTLKSVPKQVIPKSDEDKKRISELLKNNFLFSSLDDEASSDLINAMSAKTFAAGETLMNQGDDGDYFYIVESGEAHIFVKIEGEQKKVKECTAGDSFGELALMYNAPRAATVKAVTDLQTWAVDRQTFKLTLMESTINKRNRYEMFLDSVPILDTLYKWEKLTIADSLQPRQFVTGEVVMKQGETGNEFYIIEKGSVEFTQRNDTGEDVVVGEGKQGDYFGEIALLTNQGRAATVRCTSDCTLLRLDRKTFIRVMGPLDTMLKRNINKYKSWMEKKDQSK